MTKYTASQVINERARPRVLLFADREDEETLFDWVESRSGTYRRVNSLDEIDQSEWDVIVTAHPHATIQFAQTNWQLWSHGRVSSHLRVFRVFAPESIRSRRVLEYNMQDKRNADVGRALMLVTDIPGHKVRRVQELTEVLQGLVKSELVPAIEAREKQFGIRAVGEQLAPAVVDLRPFLIGPTDVILAASYRTLNGGRVWAVPSDLPRYDIWFDAALAEWHGEDPSTFPNVTTWQTSAEWDTEDERAIRAELDALNATHAEQVAQFEQERSSLELRLDEARHAAEKGPRQLLSGQDDPLQQAALNALTDLGFDVEDMDERWDPQQRREDFRIRDAGDPEWLAIADVTGVAKGAPAAKITTVVGYISKYVMEEKPSTLPRPWVIVNQLIQRDPNSRGPLYRPDEEASLAAQDGLALDTVALFVLAERIETGSGTAEKCRAWLRASRGQITLEGALAWLEKVQ